jgi:beta-lactamase regulating signal transducer with metallopeptidase domain
MSTAVITSWLLTYLVHSTLLIGAALVTARSLGDRNFALQEILLRGALIAGILTATLQVGLGVEPVSGALTVDRLVIMEHPAATTGATSEAGPDAIAVSTPPSTQGGVEVAWPLALLSLWGVGAALGLTVFIRSIIDLRNLLETRRFRPTGRLFDRLAVAMGLRRPVRLSTSPAIAVPFATGIRQPEICCPERVGDLDAEHKKGLFAHELAHLARRDPAWQLLYRLGEAILFVQPLNRLIRRRLEEIAEHLTDERAVACTGDRLGLARSLVVVAHWGVSNPPGLPAIGFAAGSRLDRRLRHLLSGTVEQHLPARWTAPLLTAALAVGVLLLPAIAPRVVHADVTVFGPDANPIHTPSPTKSATDDSAGPAPQPVEPSPPVVPVPEAVPAIGSTPRAPAAPQPVAAPASPAKPAPPVESELPASPVAEVSPVPEPVPVAPAPPSETVDPAPVPPTRIPDVRSREKAREHHHAEEGVRERSETRARQRAREVVAEARELEREATERARLTEVERETLRREARELARQAEVEAREQAQRARETVRITAAEREELRPQAEALRTAARERAREDSEKAREQARALAERARRLAEEAEAERRMEEQRQD